MPSNLAYIVLDRASPGPGLPCHGYAGSCGEHLVVDHVERGRHEGPALAGPGLVAHAGRPEGVAHHLLAYVMAYVMAPLSPGSAGEGISRQLCESPSQGVACSAATRRQRGSQAVACVMLCSAGTCQHGGAEHHPAGAAGDESSAGSGSLLGMRWPGGVKQGLGRRQGLAGHTCEADACPLDVDVVLQDQLLDVVNDLQQPMLSQALRAVPACMRLILTNQHNSHDLPACDHHSP